MSYGWDLLLASAMLLRLHGGSYLAPYLPSPSASPPIFHSSQSLALRRSLPHALALLRQQPPPTSPPLPPIPALSGRLFAPRLPGKKAVAAMPAAEQEEAKARRKAAARAYSSRRNGALLACALAAAARWHYGWGDVRSYLGASS